MRLAIALLASLAACDVGEVGGNNPPGTDAGSNMTEEPASFATTFTPLAMAKGCGQATVNGTGCHGGVQPPLLNMWTGLTANTPRYLGKPAATMSILVTKTTASALHNGVPYWDATELAAVAAWIDSLP